MLNRSAAVLMLFCISFSAFAQKKPKEDPVKVISRTVEGEIRTNYNDTLVGKIKVKAYQDKYITSIFFMQKGKAKQVFSAYDIARFRQVVPYPDRAEFGVDEVYYKSMPHPKDEKKKAFVRIEEWQ